jgi:hypothetical protein
MEAFSRFRINNFAIPYNILAEYFNISCKLTPTPHFLVTPFSGKLFKTRPEKDKSKRAAEQNLT